MKRWMVSVVAVLCVLALSSSCDREQTPGADEQAAKNAEAAAWRSLSSSLDQAPNDAARVAMLEKFIADNPQHPDVPEAKRRIEELKTPPNPFEATAKSAMEGKPQDLATYFVAGMAPLVVERSKVVPLEEPIALPSPEGEVTFEKAVLTTPQRLRSNVRRWLMKYAPDRIEERCNDECVNGAVSKLLEPAIGGPLFAEPGVVNKEPLAALLEKGWVAPDAQVGGVPAQKFYSVYRPTVDAYAKVGKAVADAGVEDALKQLASISEPRERMAFYHSWTQDKKIPETTGFEEKVASNYASFWLRRHADGTAPTLMAFLEKVQGAYDSSAAKPAE